MGQPHDDHQLSRSFGTVVPPRIAEELQRIEQHIRAAWALALISGTITAAVVLVPPLRRAVPLADAWAIADVATVYALAYGVWRRSRAAAVILVLYFAGSKIYVWVETGTFEGIGVVTLIFLYAFVMGAVATFRYHALAGSSRAGG